MLGEELDVIKVIFIICKSAFLDFVHPYFNKIKIKTFRKLDLLPSLDKKGKDRNPSCWAPWLS
jgi:hypothetical protein